MPLLCIQHSKLSDIGCHRHKSCLTSIPVVYTCFLLMFVHLSLMSFETLQENRLERDLQIRCPTVGFKSSGDDTSISLFVIHSCLIANNKGAVGWSWEQCGFDHNCWRLVKVSHQLPVPAQRPVLANASGHKADCIRQKGTNCAILFYEHDQHEVPRAPNDLIM